MLQYVWLEFNNVNNVIDNSFITAQRDQCNFLGISAGLQWLNG